MTMNTMLKFLLITGFVLICTPVLATGNPGEKPVAVTSQTATSFAAHLANLPANPPGLTAAISPAGMVSKRAGTETAASDIPDVIVIPNRNTTNSMRVRGRIQGQYAFSSGSNDGGITDADDYSSFEIRRVRLGVQGTLYGDFSYLVEANVLSNADLDAATLTYSGLPSTNITFGKAKPRFGHEQNTSSASILTFERTRLDGHLNGGKPIGLRLNGSILLLSYYLGVYNGQSVGTGRMGSDTDSYLLNASGGLNLDGLIADGFQTRFRADYLHRTNSNGYYRFEDAFAVSGQFGTGGIDLRAEYLSGSDSENGDISGFYILPSVFIVPETFQAVARYEQISGDTGVSVGQNRYADRVPNLYASGDEYTAWYIGVNYYIHSHNLKFMLGYELAENRNSDTDVSGKASTIFSGFRMQF